MFNQKRHQRNKRSPSPNKYELCSPAWPVHTTRHYHFQEEKLQYAEIDVPESDKLPPTKDTILYTEMNEEQPIARKDIE